MAIPNKLNPFGIFYNKPHLICEHKSDGNAHTYKLVPGYYELTCVGGGGGQAGYSVAGGYAWGSGGGGSGACVRVQIKVNVATNFTVLAGKVGKTDRGYLTSGGDAQDCYIKDQFNNRIICKGAGTGSKGYDKHGFSGKFEVDSGFVSKYIIKTIQKSNGKDGEGSAVLAGWGTGGASVYSNWGRGAGPKDQNGTGGYIKIYAIK